MDIYEEYEKAGIPRHKVLEIEAAIRFNMGDIRGTKLLLRTAGTICRTQEGERLRKDYELLERKYPNE